MLYVVVQCFSWHGGFHRFCSKISKTCRVMQTTRALMQLRSWKFNQPITFVLNFPCKAFLLGPFVALNPTTAGYLATTTTALSLNQLNLGTLWPILNPCHLNLSLFLYINATMGIDCTVIRILKPHIYDFELNSFVSPHVCLLLGFHRDM